MQCGWLGFWAEECSISICPWLCYSYFSAERKAAIPLEDATVKLSESYKTSLSPGMPEFCTAHTVNLTLIAFPQFYNSWLLETVPTNVRK